jgi:DNA-binding GntR family transcriptional regulator
VEEEIAPLSRSPLRTQVTDLLRAAIVSGRMTPGEVYSAPGLAARFGTSATPVREALLELARDGLVAAVPNKGFRVTQPEPAELDGISEVRMLLEPAAAARAATLPPDERRRLAERLRPLAAQILAAARDGDVLAHLRADREFHATLLAAGGNPVLTEIVLRLRDRSRLYGLDPLAAADRLAESAAEHDTVLDLLEQGRAADLETALRQHVGHVRGEWSGG